MSITPITGPRVIVALDFPDRAPAIALVDRIRPELCRLKVGKEMFTRLGPDFVRELVGRGFDVFLDLKFHDIPNTVAAACAAAADLGVWMTNVHAGGGRRMMEAARERLEGCNHRPLLIAVTVLTSLAREDLAEIGFDGEPLDNVLRLARLAHTAGTDGVVCSPLEVSTIRSSIGGDFRLVTPGIRPADPNAPADDQRRVMTPGRAMAQGSDFLVIGRPITGAPDPLLRLQEIATEIAAFESANLTE